ncbi:MAG: hypothetical protein KTR31_18265 [Myxococcales bacterium]|nr:hypothetical protein [Myxococcales bacterium]
MWWLLLFLACRPEAEPEWFGDPGPVADACPEPPPATTGAPLTVPIRVVLGEGVNPDEASWYLRWASSWWRRHGVTLVAAGRSESTDGAPILAGGEARTLRDVLAPVRRRLTDRSSTAPAAVDVVFLPALAHAGSPVRQWFERLAGLTVSDVLLQRLRDADPHAELLKAAVVEGPYVPTVFLGLDTLDALPNERSRFVLPHELGHALGLVHHLDDGNLMEVGFPRCEPRLLQAQRDALRVSVP